MNPSDLARLMLKWEQMQRSADEVAEAIKDAVREIGASQTVGNVKATYRNGSKRYDYQNAVAISPYNSPELLEPFIKTTYDWRMACIELGIEDIPFTQGEPSVSLKLVEAD